MKKILAIFVFGALLMSCKKKDVDDNEITIDPEVTTGTTTPTTDGGSNSGTGGTGVTSVTLINDFIWEGLNQYYYWQEDVDNLADTVIDDVASYINLLNSQNNPSDFFYSLNHPDDRFSWIEENYRDLQNQLSGISASNGMKFLIYRRCSDCNELVAIVTYVLPDSDAAEKGIVRGDTFTIVNGQELTISNYSSLLYGEDLTYTIDLVDYDAANNVATPRNISVSLTKEENFQENPIHKSMAFDVNGRVVGYLMYNQFVGAVDSDDDDQIDVDFNELLVQTFTEFGNLGVQDLVVDLRYNGGGSVQTCTYLASMITGQHTGSVFAQQRWNSKLMAYINAINSDNNDNNNIETRNTFVNATTAGTSLPSLNLQRVYILTTNRSASASELLINGLASYINVIQVGTTTYGKNVGSISLYDYVDAQAPFDSINQAHDYAMQPIVLKIANNDGYADYANGLPPEDRSVLPNLDFIEVRESISNFGTLGDPNEPMLATALNHITNNNNKYEGLENRILLPEVKLPKKVTDQYRLNIDNFPKLPLKKLR